MLALENTDPRPEVCTCCATWHIGSAKGLVLQHTSGLHGERQGSGSPGKQHWSQFYHRLGSGCRVSDNSADIRNTCEDSGVHMWPGLHIALSFFLFWKTNARKMIDFSEAGK